MSFDSKNQLDTPLALSMGDPAGIGPDITLQAWSDRAANALPPFVVAGDPDLFAGRARILGLDIAIEQVDAAAGVHELFAHALPVFPVRLPTKTEPGVGDALCADAIITAIDTCVDWVRKGKARAVVTNPINKRLLSAAGFEHPGHTQYLAELCATSDGTPRPVMMLVCGDLRVVPATVHIPLKDVPGALTQELIVETVDIAVQDLRDCFGISTPRIAVTGLNPHAGEDGMLGCEESETITPAIVTLQAKGLDVTGPLPADALFQERTRNRYDVIIAMYHDQALIPVKTLAFDKAVNVTLGLPIIRTSPDHGTAYELAGSGGANPGSLITALKLADALAVRKMAAA